MLGRASSRSVVDAQRSLRDGEPLVEDSSEAVQTVPRTREPLVAACTS